MLAAATTGSDQYVLDLSKTLTDVMDATNSNEGIESLLVTVGNRLAQLREYNSVDFRSLANAVRSSQPGSRFSGGSEVAIQYQRVGTSVFYNEVSSSNFNDCNGGSDTYLHQMMLTGLGELSYSGNSGNSMSNRGQAACQVQQIATGSFAGAVVGGAIGASFGGVPGAIAGARIGSGLGGLIGAADSFRLCPIEGTKTGTDTSTSDNNTGTGGNNEGDTGTSGSNGSNDTPEDDPNKDPDDDGCTVNPDHWNLLKDESLFELNGIDHKSIATMFFKADFVKEKEILSNNNELNRVPLVMTKIGENFKREDLHMGLIFEDQVWRGITNEMLSVISQVQLRRSLNHDAMTNSEDILLDVDPNRLNNRLVDSANYGVSIERGSVKTGSSVELDNGETVAVKEPFATFMFDSPALQNLVGSSFVTVTGNAAIAGYADYLKFLSAIAKDMDQVTNFGDHSH
jgi:hypothetical protein